MARKGNKQCSATLAPRASAVRPCMLRVLLEEMQDEPALVCMILPESTVSLCRVCKWILGVLRKVRPPLSIRRHERSCPPPRIVKGIRDISTYFSITALRLEPLVLLPSTARGLLQTVLACRELTKLVLLLDTTTFYNVDLFVHGIQGCHKLEHLTLSYGRHVQLAMCGTLCKALQSASRLTGIHLAMPPMEANGLREILSGLDACTNLQRLCLGYHSIKDDGMYALAPVLCRMSQLSDLDLTGSQITAEGASDLVHSLSPNLRVLKLHTNRLQDDGAAYLGGVWERCPSLQVLGLMRNGIGPNGLRALFAQGTKPLLLRELCLDLNKTGSQGAQTLAEGAARFACLQSLSLSHNGIGEAAGPAVAQLLTLCTALSTLNLKCNDLRDAVGNNVLPVLATCTALAHLDLRANNISSSQISDLCTFASTHTALKLYIFSSTLC